MWVQVLKFGIETLAEFFSGLVAKTLAGLELDAAVLATSAYNLGKSGLRSKVLRTIDLIEEAMAGIPVLGAVDDFVLGTDGEPRWLVRGLLMRPDLHGEFSQ